MSAPEPRVVGQLIAGGSWDGPIWTTQVECPICYALIAGDRQEQHKAWHASLAPSIRDLPGEINAVIRRGLQELSDKQRVGTRA